MYSCENPSLLDLCVTRAKVLAVAKKKRGVDLGGFSLSLCSGELWFCLFGGSRSINPEMSRGDTGVSLRTCCSRLVQGIKPQCFLISLVGELSSCLVRWGRGQPCQVGSEPNDATFPHWHGLADARRTFASRVT